MPDNPVTPEDVLCNSDPGDDTFRRYRYQGAYAAILATRLLEPEPEYEYLYCEHHEDVLLKRRNGDFCGVQVKTRAEGYEPFKANEEQIKSALKRFVIADIQYPGQFFRFVIATNSGFWREKENSSNLKYMLSQARSCIKDNVPAPASLLRYVKEFKPDSTTGDVVVLNVLSRVELQEGLPHLDGIEERLIRHLNSLSFIAGSCYDTLQSAASAITDRVCRAASKACESHLKDYAAVMENPDESTRRIIVSAKKIIAGDIIDILKGASNDVILLRSAGQIDVASLPSGFSKMEMKMTKGLIDADNIDVLKDMKASAEAALTRRLYKQGSDRTNEEYGHLQTMVNLDCREAFDMTKSPDEPFGMRMLQEVRRRLRERAQNESLSLFGFKYEHLLGCVAILTEECKVWWSERFNLDAEVSV